MKLGILGTGTVGETIASKLVERGNSVMMGSRSATNEKALSWIGRMGKDALCGTFADAAAFGEIVFNCTRGDASLAALQAAGADNLTDKILVDVSNPLDFSKGMPPTLLIFNDDSLGEQIQRAFPRTRVVKTLNTINCQVMVDPARIQGNHDLFMSGNDPEAKAHIARLLRDWFGWDTIIDLGDISTARGTESYLPLWLRLWGALQTPDFNVKVVH